MISHAASCHDPFSAVAREYYDHRRHPTTANLKDGSSRLALRWLPGAIEASHQICEVGAGRSLVGEWLARTNQSLAGLTIVDASASMLAFSKEWQGRGARLVVARAEQLPLRADSQDLVVALLGDSYNNPTFWAEVSRVLTPGGQVIFTSPSYQWATQYRDAARDLQCQAVFDVADGRRIGVPSVVLDPAQQFEMIRHEGFDVSQPSHVFGSEISLPHSRKIWLAVAEGLPIVSGYLARKPKS